MILSQILQLNNNSNLLDRKINIQGPVIDIFIKNKPIAALLDTGAICSLIKAEFASSFPKKQVQGLSLKSISNHKIYDDGFAMVTLQVSNKIVTYPFVIVDEEVLRNHDILLGYDFAETFNVKVNPEQNQIESSVLGGIPLSSTRQNFLHKFNLQNEIVVKDVESQKILHKPEKSTQYKDDEVIYAEVKHIKKENLKWKLFTSEKCTLPPSSRVAIPINTDGLPPNKCAVIQPSKRLLRTNHLIIPHMVIDKNTKYVNVINLSNFPKQLCSKTCLGKLYKFVHESEIKHNQHDSDDHNAHSISAVSNETKSEEEIRALHEKTFQMGPSMSNDTKKKLHDLLYEYHDIFRWDSKEHTICKNFKYHIEVGDAKAIQVDGFPKSEKEHQIIDKEVEALLEKKVISPSHSPWRTYAFIVDQKDEKGDLKQRMVIDFRELNKLTRPLAFPLPRIDEIWDKMKNAKYISSLDVNSAFHQIPLDDSSKELTAFATRKGLFEFNSMAFGLINCPGAFSQLMAAVLVGLEGPDLSYFIDDLICCTKTEKEHLKKLKSLFQRLRFYNLKLKPSKARFLFEGIKILGLTVSSKGIKMDEAQVDAIQNLPTPKTRKALEKMLGAFTFFVASYATIVKLQGHYSNYFPKIPGTTGRKYMRKHLKC